MKKNIDLLIIKEKCPIWWGPNKTIYYSLFLIMCISRYITVESMCVHVQSLSHVWLRNPMDCSPLGSSVHGILQARILEGVAIFFSRGASRPRNWTQVSKPEPYYIGCIMWASKQPYKVGGCLNTQFTDEETEAQTGQSRPRLTVPFHHRGRIRK